MLTAEQRCELSSWDPAVCVDGAERGCHPSTHTLRRSDSTHLTRSSRGDEGHLPSFAHLRASSLAPGLGHCMREGPGYLPYLEA